jgi:hypothetical protein
VQGEQCDTGVHGIKHSQVWIDEFTRESIGLFLELAFLAKLAIIEPALGGAI